MLFINVPACVAASKVSLRVVARLNPATLRVCVSRVNRGDFEDWRFVLRGERNPPAGGKWDERIYCGEELPRDFLLSAW